MMMQSSYPMQQQQQQSQQQQQQLSLQAQLQQQMQALALNNNNGNNNNNRPRPQRYNPNTMKSSNALAESLIPMQLGGGGGMGGGGGPPNLSASILSQIQNQHPTITIPPSPPQNAMAGYPPVNASSPFSLNTPGSNLGNMGGGGGGGGLSLPNMTNMSGLTSLTSPQLSLSMDDQFGSPLGSVGGGGGAGGGGGVGMESSEQSLQVQYHIEKGRRLALKHEAQLLRTMIDTERKTKDELLAVLTTAGQITDPVERSKRLAELLTQTSASGALSLPNANPMPANYKTSLCKNWQSTGHCTYDKACQFAHGQQELRPPPPKKPVDPSRYKTTMCINWLNTGTCRYESVCRFAHGTGELNAPNPPLGMGMENETDFM